MSPEELRALYRRHEVAVLRTCMARVRSPEVAAELTAETFAAASAGSFDASRESEAEWIARLAERELDAAYRTGAVGGSARARARVGTITLDRRSLDRVWQLRGESRDLAPKPRVSSAVVLAGDGAVGDVPVLLPAVEAALVAAAGRRHGRRRVRRRVSVGLRVAVAVLSLGWVTAQLLIPDRPSSAVAYATWLPFAKSGVDGFHPRTWSLATAHQSPAGGRDRVALTTFSTGGGTDPRCGALHDMTESDALVFIYDRPDRRRLEASVRECAPDARIEWHDRSLIVIGPSAPRGTRADARGILERLR